MPSPLIEILKQNSNPLQPIPAELSPRLTKLQGIRAVLFDIYGTLLISGSGDVGTADERQHESAFRTALEKVGVSLLEDASATLLQEEIQNAHHESRADGIDYPEVEIRQIWERVLLNLADGGRIPPLNLSTSDIEALCIHHEVLTNPVWPMPNCRECLQELDSRGLALGIISNAQFYTPLLFEALLGKTLEDIGVKKELQVFSFEWRQGKPGLFLYEKARERLTNVKRSPEQVLYVGNDMLKDVYPAKQLGFKTALFAGDARSLRLRETDPRTANLEPDLIITDLAQIPECLEAN